MERKSIAQEYYILVTDKYGVLPSMRREESGAGLAAAAFMDLLSAGIIAEEKKKIEVVKDLPYELRHLQPLYVYLREKHCYVNKIMTDSVFEKQVQTAHGTDWKIFAGGRSGGRRNGTC